MIDCLCLCVWSRSATLRPRPALLCSCVVELTCTALRFAGPGVLGILVPLLCGSCTPALRNRGANSSIDEGCRLRRQHLRCRRLGAGAFEAGSFRIFQRRTALGMVAHAMLSCRSPRQHEAKSRRNNRHRQGGGLALLLDAADRHPPAWPSSSGTARKVMLFGYATLVCDCGVGVVIARIGESCCRIVCPFP